MPNEDARERRRAGKLACQIAKQLSLARFQAHELFVARRGPVLYTQFNVPKEVWTMHIRPKLKTWFNALRLVSRFFAHYMDPICEPEWMYHPRPLLYPQGSEVRRPETIPPKPAWDRRATCTNHAPTMRQPTPVHQPRSYTYRAAGPS